MRPRTAAGLATILVLLGTALAVGLLWDSGTAIRLEEQWVSETAMDVGGNHHAAAAGVVNGTGLVFAPISGTSGTDQCALYALRADTGTVRWQYPIPPANCTVHSVADPTLADFDGDGTREVLVATTERELTAWDPFTGAVELRYPLSSYGYSRPIVADFTGDQRPEVVAVDVSGTVTVLTSEGQLVWSRRLGGHAWGQPAIVDVDGNGTPELVVGLGGERGLHRLESDGSAGWEVAPSFLGSITWMTTAQVDADGGKEVVVGTVGGTVAVVDGTAGAVQWRHDLGRLAAVRAVGDGDGDGKPEVYAVAADGVLRSLDARDGSVKWTTRLAAGTDVQMMPPPSLVDVTGDGKRELIAPSNDGMVAVLDPTTGTVRATYRRPARIFAPASIADTNGDGVPEIYIVYADGGVVALRART